MGRIVVGIDGSENSYRALDWAADEAKLRGATLHLVHSWKFPPPEPYVPGELPHIDIEGAANRVLDDASARLDARFDRSIAVQREIANDAPGQALIGASGGADLVVVGARGLGGFKGLMLGSVSQQVAQHALCPIVIVPHERQG